MIHIHKPVSRNIITLILFLFIFTVGTGVVMSSEEIEETAEMTLSGDTALIGKMDDYSSRSIIVDNVRYTLCDNIKIFSPRDTMLPLNDIDTAQEVRLFINNNCVRKINVLRFAE